MDWIGSCYGERCGVWPLLVPLLDRSLLRFHACADSKLVSFWDPGLPERAGVAGPSDGPQGDGLPASGKLLKHQLKQNSVKIYDKQGSVLRRRTEVSQAADERYLDALASRFLERIATR